MTTHQESGGLLRALPHALAWLLALVLVPTQQIYLQQDFGLPAAAAWVLSVLQASALPVAARRALPGWVWAAATDLAAALTVLGTGRRDVFPWPWAAPALIGYLFVLLTVGLRESRRTAAAVWAATALLGFGVSAAVPRQHGFGDSLIVLFLGGVVLVAGYAVRERGQTQRRLVEQERISEAERARRMLLEERARIARELHDVVAHHMSVIAVQADSAPYRITGLPEAATEEFASIGGAARESLTELRRLLGVLRSEDAAVERAPQPGVEELPRLVAATGRAGLPVGLEVAEGLGEPGALPRAVDLSAYRIVQEALSNVVRHAPGAPTRVRLERAEGARTGAPREARCCGCRCAMIRLPTAAGAPRWRPRDRIGPATA
ncbi:sensor histidine kinase [Phaeacidiphilus oryzae]|uniref:sensor histidine kinase n=1 Tax=Phaeacidiphilus oryzae TaxID=348818 RepID=UPI00068E33C6|nr:histidine kinase [Phaeacidiphilus oryzae]